MKHNNVLPNAHFRKNWKGRVKTWLDQAGRKKARRAARQLKAKTMAPRPTEALRPAVHCPTLKYNTRLRAGRGFTKEEIKAAGITKVYARSVGISVDHRRRNRSEESLLLNKDRLTKYIENLIVFPTAAAAAAAPQVQLAAFKIDSPALEPARVPTEAEKSGNAYLTLRKAWNLQRYAGIRAKRAADKEEAPEKKK